MAQTHASLNNTRMSSIFDAANSATEFSTRTYNDMRAYYKSHSSHGYLQKGVTPKLAVSPLPLWGEEVLLSELCSSQSELSKTGGG